MYPPECRVIPGTSVARYTNSDDASSIPSEKRMYTPISDAILTAPSEWRITCFHLLLWHICSCHSITGFPKYQFWFNATPYAMIAYGSHFLWPSRAIAGIVYNAVITISDQGHQSVMEEEAKMAPINIFIYLLDNIFNCYYSAIHTSAWSRHQLCRDDPASINYGVGDQFQNLGSS